MAYLNNWKIIMSEASNKTEIQLMAEGLTDLQRRVVSNVVSGDFKSNRASYYDAGGDATDDNSADSAVSTMLRDVKVKAYKDALLEEIDRKSILSRTELLKLTSEIAKGMKFTIDPDSPQDEVAQLKTQLLAGKQLSDMEGFNAPKELNVNTDFESKYTQKLQESLK